jgi:large subunit ribosomal protein L10
VNAGIINRESLPLILGKAYVEMLAVAKIAGTGAIDEELENLLGAAAAAAAAVSAPAAKNDEAPAEEEEEEEEASEEDALEGLGALFG